MEIQIGYKLVETKNTQNAIQTWGGINGESYSIPSFIVLPNGDQLFGIEVDTDYQGYKVIPWIIEESLPPPPPVPLISDRQFFQQAAIDGIITTQEALAAVQTGSIPSALQTIIDSIEDENEKFAATMILAGATTFDRNHPLTEIIRQHFNKTNEEIDQFFRSAHCYENDI